MRRPVVSLVVACVLLLACASFYLQLDKGSVGVDTLPSRLEISEASKCWPGELPGQPALQLVVVVDGDAVTRRAGGHRLPSGG